MPALSIVKVLLLLVFIVVFIVVVIRNSSKSSRTLEIAVKVVEHYNSISSSIYSSISSSHISSSSSSGDGTRSQSVHWASSKKKQKMKNIMSPIFYGRSRAIAQEAERAK